MKEFEIPNILVNSKALATVFNLAKTYISKYTQEGILEKDENNLYDLFPSITAYITHLRDRDSGTLLSLNEERAMLTKTNREKSQIELAEMRGDLIKKSVIEKEAFNKARTVRDNLLNIPERLSAQLSVEQYDLLKNEIIQALESLSK